MQGHELLQAIARVNRTHPRKSCGFIIDDLYFAVHRSHKRKTVSITIDRGGELIVNPDFGFRKQWLAENGSRFVF